jgi:PilZ domain
MMGAMTRTRVTYERPNSRRDHRYPLPPLVIIIDGTEYSSINWSLGGFLITGFDRKIASGQTVTGMLRTLDQPGFAFTATVVRSGDTAPDHLAVKFSDLSDRGMSVLERIITRRLFHH